MTTKRNKRETEDQSLKRQNARWPPQKSSTNELAKVQVDLVTSTANSSHLKKVKGRIISVLLKGEVHSKMALFFFLQWKANTK